MHPLRVLALVVLAALVALPAFAKEKKFTDDDASKEKDEPTTWLKDYDKLVEGEGGRLGLLRRLLRRQLQDRGREGLQSPTRRSTEAKHAAEYGKEYAEQWIQKSKKLGWEVAEKGKADLTIEGNVAHAWEPSGAARFWGGWYANPGAVQELIGKDSSGKIVFQIRHKSRGSTIRDAIENGLEDCRQVARKGEVSPGAPAGVRGHERGRRGDSPPSPFHARPPRRRRGVPPRHDGRSSSLAGSEGAVEDPASECGANPPRSLQISWFW